MKAYRMMLLAVVLVSTALGQSAPRGSFTAGEYEAAKAEAKESGKPIAIVTTNIKSSCPKCLAGNEAAFKKMKSDYVLVIDDDEAKQGGELPKNIKQLTYPIYKSKGNIIPIIAVLSPENEKLVGGLCYKQISGDGSKAFKTLEEEVAKGMADEPAKETEPEAPATKAGLQDWTNTDGKTIKAEAISRTETSVTLKLQNGKTVDYPLEKLSEESRKLIVESLGSE